MKRGKIDRKLSELIKNAKPMTPAQRCKAMVGMVYGNMRLSGIDVTRAEVELTVEHVLMLDAAKTWPVKK